MADNQFIARKGLISLDDSQITGSLSITNAVTASVFTGSFRGDGTNLYNIPSSGVTGLNLDKIISGSVSASISPNNGFRINTDVYIDGTITAKEFHTDYVTSSVLYQSGSTKFGDTLDDLHEFTGSVTITGSITLNGQAIGTGKLDETTFESFTSSYTTGSFTGSFIGDGSQLTGIDGFPFTGSAKITGSLAVTGSLTVDGNVNATSFTGSIQGTATTASYVNLTNVDGFSAYSSSVSSSINSVLNATTPVTSTVNNTNSPFTITNQTIVIVDSTNGDVTINLPDLDTVVGTPNQRPIIIYKNDYSQNVVFVEPSGSQLVNGTTRDIIASIQIGIVYNPTSAGWVTEGTSYQSLAELELFFVPRTETGSLSVSTASYVEYTNVANKPSLVSGSSQISFNGITDKPTLVSGSSQITYSGLTGVPSGIVSGSSQITYSGLTGTPSGIVSGSSQVLNYGIFATTGSNTFVGSQVITGSLYITTDLIVQGSSSLQNITASAVSIGTNTVILNTDTPAVRFAGISVQDSGSNAGVTGSIFWDGLCNRWVYSNPSGIGYSGGMLLSGPRTQTLGTEPTLTCNYIAKSGGGDHLYDSCIIDDGTTTCIKNNLIGTGTATFGSDFTSYGTFGSFGQLSIAGVTDPNKKLSIGYNTSANAAFIQSMQNGTAYTPLLLNSSGGNVGIGACTPSANGVGGNPITLNIHKAGSDVAVLSLSNTSTTKDVAVGAINFASTGLSCTDKRLAEISATKSNNCTNTAAGNLSFYTSDNGGLAERMRITNDGNVGIGLTPSGWASGTESALQIKNASIYEYGKYEVGLQVNAFYNTTVAPAGWKYIDTGIQCISQLQLSGGDLNYNIANPGTAGCGITWNTKFNITRAGNVGIGTATPTGGISGTETALEISNSNVGVLAITSTSASGKKYQIYSSNDGGLFFRDATCSAQRMTISTLGNVGIGTTSVPSDHILQVHNNNSYARMALTNTSTGVASGDGLIFQMEHCFAIIKNQETSCLVLGTNGRETDIVIGTNGGVGIGQSPINKFTILAGNSNVLDLFDTGAGFGIGMQAMNSAATVYRSWDFYASKYSFFSGQAAFSCQICASSGVKFGSGATTLNYYEQGTWTPRLKNGSFTTNAGAGNSGWYTRIGNIVTVGGTLDWGAGSGAQDGNSLQIACLPFASSNTNGERNVGQFGAPAPNSIGFKCTGKGQLTLVNDPGASYIYLIETYQDGSYMTYRHDPLVGNAGTIYGFQMTYHI